MTPAVPLELDNLSAYTRQQCQHYQLPALAVAVWTDNRLYQSTTGILNLETGVEANTDSLFQIGSISKVMTTCLIMQAVERGLLDLDRPVKHYLRGFYLADAEAAAHITVGQLLDHSSGIDGDILGDISYSDEPAIARFVDRASQARLLHRPGEGFSYSNAAFNIAGRLLEVVTGQSWFNAVEQQLFKPLGMQRAVAHPSQLLRFRGAMGHLRHPEESQRWQLATQCYLPMGWAPAGATISLAPAELVRFGRAHFDPEAVMPGEHWLSETALTLMQQPRLSLPQSCNKFASHWGLGWQLLQNRGTPILSHSGATWGQGAMLVVIPEHKIVIALQQNAGNSVSLDNMMIDLVQQLTGIDINPEPTSDTLCSIDGLDILAGNYISGLADRTVEIDKGQLLMHSTPKLVGWARDTWILKPINGHRFAAFNQQGDRLGNVVFLNPDSHGVPQSLHSQLRLHHRETY